MQRRLLPVLLGSLLLAAISPGRAVTFSVNVLSNTAWTTTGITSDHGLFTNTLMAFNSSLLSPSVISFGTTITTNNDGNNGSDTFNNNGASVSFDFNVTDNGNGITHQYVVMGSFVGINGSNVAKMSVKNGVGSSQAAFQTASITVDGSQVFSTKENSPTGIPSIVTDVMFGSDNVNLWVDYRDQLTAPDQQNNLSIGGYLETGNVNTVPEPGSMALLIGSGTGASLFFLRRRNKTASGL